MVSSSDTPNSKTTSSASMREEDLQKTIFNFVYGTEEEPSNETVERAGFVQSFLTEYYKSAADQGRGWTATEHPSMFNALNGVEEGERGNLLLDLTSKLAEKISSKYKILASKVSSIGGSEQGSRSGKPGSEAEMGKLPVQLQLFVDNVNQSLEELGAAKLTADELKLLLATAPLPGFGAESKNNVTSSDRSYKHRSVSVKEGLALNNNNNNSKDEPKSVGRARSHSSATTNPRLLPHSVSDKGFFAAKATSTITTTSTTTSATTSTATPTTTSTATPTSTSTATPATSVSDKGFFTTKATSTITTTSTTTSTATPTTTSTATSTTPSFFPVAAKREGLSVSSDAAGSSSLIIVGRGVAAEVKASAESAVVETQVGRPRAASESPVVRPVVDSPAGRRRAVSTGSDSPNVRPLINRVLTRSLVESMSGEKLSMAAAAKSKKEEESATKAKKEEESGEKLNIAAKSKKEEESATKVKKEEESREKLNIPIKSGKDGEEEDGEVKTEEESADMETACVVVERALAETAEEELLGRIRAEVVCSPTFDDFSTRPRRHSSGDAKERKREKPQRRISMFFTKKMESVANLLERMDSSDSLSGTAGVGSDSRKVLPKTKSFTFGSPAKSGAETPNTSKSGYATPRSGYATPRSGYATPRGEEEEGESVDVLEALMAPLKHKIAMVEKALCDEVVVRTEAERKVANMEEMVCRLKSEVERVQQQYEQVNAVNNQMGVELRLLRQRNTTNGIERQQVENALVGETKKRRVLEAEISMLVKTYQESNSQNAAKAEQTVMSPKQRQEVVLAQQREEVLLAVVESMRMQMDEAEAEREKAKQEWNEERVRYQEVHDHLRFQIDQLTDKLSAAQQQPPAKPPSEFDQQVEEVINRFSDREGGGGGGGAGPRGLARMKSSYDLTKSSDSIGGSGTTTASLVTTSDDASTPSSESTPLSPPPTQQQQQQPSQPSSTTVTPKKNSSYAQRMKLFFLSSFWWPNFDALRGESSAQPMRTPVLLLQIAWWVAELREYIQDIHLKQKFRPHSNQFCNCDDCMTNAINT